MVDGGGFTALVVTISYRKQSDSDDGMLQSQKRLTTE